MILVDDAAEDLLAPYGRVEVDDDSRIVVGRAVVSALVWTMPVEVPLVLAEHGPSVALVVDQHSVGALGPDTEHEPLGVRVGRRSRLHGMRTIGTNVFG